MPHKCDQERLLEPNMRRTLHAILKLASIGKMLTFLPCNNYVLRRKKNAIIFLLVVTVEWQHLQLDRKTIT